MVGRARFLPWLVKEADPQIGHLIEFAATASQMTNNESCVPMYIISGTYRRLVR